MHQTDNPEIYPYIWSKSIFDSGANYSVEEGESFQQMLNRIYSWLNNSVYLLKSLNYTLTMGRFYM